MASLNSEVGFLLEVFNYPLFDIVSVGLFPHFGHCDFMFAEEGVYILGRGEGLERFRSLIEDVVEFQHALEVGVYFGVLLEVLLGWHGKFVRLNKVVLDLFLRLELFLIVFLFVESSEHREHFKFFPVHNLHLMGNHLGWFAFELLG